MATTIQTSCPDIDLQSLGIFYPRPVEAKTATTTSLRLYLTPKSWLPSTTSGMYAAFVASRKEKTGLRWTGDCQGVVDTKTQTTPTEMTVLR
jgi:hypothetical protein